MPGFLTNRTFITLLAVIAAVAVAVFLYKTLRLIAERAAYNGDDVFGYKVFYKKDSLAAFLEKQ